MVSALIDTLQTHHGVGVVDVMTAQGFLEQGDGPADRILFFTGDPARRPEANDVAVILPQLLQAFEGKFEAAVVDPSAEADLMAKYGVMFLPALVFLRGGEFVGIIPKIKDWSVYMEMAGGFLSAPARPLDASTNKGDA